MLAFLLLSISCAFAQKLTVKGTVLDETGETIIGATIREKGVATNGAQTDIDGHFTLTVKQGATIIVSYVGYKTQEVKAAAQLTIKMVPDNELLDEVVVVAYGTAKKQSLVGAQSNVTAKQLESRPITNVSSALAAAAPGVQVTTSTGQPGSTAGIMIRGFGSINASSAPLFVVDGAVYTGSIADISPADIASVSILKDAASTALYGSSAGNGVIMITTKSGARSNSGKPSFNVTVNVGASRRGQERYETVNATDYTRLMWRQFYNTNLYELGRTPEQAWLFANAEASDDMKYMPFAGVKTDVGIDANSFRFNEKNKLIFDLTTGPKGSFDQVDVPLFGSTENLWMSPLLVGKDGMINPEITGLLWADDLDWESQLYRTGLRQEYVVNSGYSNDKVTSFLSLSYLGEQGYKRFTDFKRLSTRANIAYNVTDWLKIGTNAALSITDIESTKSPQGKGYFSDPFYFISAIAPIYPIHRHNPDGSYELDEKGNKIYDYSETRPWVGRYNPVYEQTLDKNFNKRDVISSRTFLEAKLYEGLMLRVNYAMDLSAESNKTRYNNIMGDQPQGLLTQDRWRDQVTTFNQLLTYNKEFGDHGIEALLGHESYEAVFSNMSAAKENMFFLGVDEFSNLTKMNDISSYTSTYRKEGYFGRLNYNYADRYNVSASYRRDGSSRFAPDKRWGNFWSFGAGWNIASESFMESAREWLNFLKLRMSIGQTGNDNLGTYYAYQTLYSTQNNYYDLGLRVNSPGNRDLVWEKQTAYDLALEFSVFNRLSGTVELFNKESDDLIFDYSLPVSTGLGSINKNIGKVRNYGMEMDLKLNLINTNDFRWDVNWNGTIFKNKIVRLPEENREKGIETGISKWVEGGSIKDFYLREFIGVDPDNGRSIYRIDKELYPSMADPTSEDFVGLAKEGEKAEYTYFGKYAAKHFCGSSIPDLYGGFGTSLSWKGVDFNLLFSYQLGGKVYDYGYSGLMGRILNGGRTFHVDALKAWQKPGDPSGIPALYSGKFGEYNNDTSDRYLTSASSLMLKSISLGYNLPKSWLEYIQVSGARISIAGENLFLVSARKGLNPMGSYSGAAYNTSFGFARTLTATLNLTF